MDTVWDHELGPRRDPSVHAPFWARLNSTTPAVVPSGTAALISLSRRTKAALRAASSCTACKEQREASGRVGRCKETRRVFHTAGRALRANAAARSRDGPEWVRCS